MSTLEELKKVWDESQNVVSISKPYDHAALSNIVRARSKKHLNAAMQYFWASFALQILVYALLSHVIIKFGEDTETLLSGIGGIMLFIPFTVTLMRKFKRLAVTKPEEENSGTSLYHYVQRQYALLKSFYTFKRRYEIMLIPLSTAIGTFLIFRLYVPGGVMAHSSIAIAIFMISLISCGVAIVSENRKSFERPLHDLKMLIEEFKLKG